jgi:hypothetical protein
MKYSEKDLLNAYELGVKQSIKRNGVYLKAMSDWNEIKKFHFDPIATSRIPIANFIEKCKSIRLKHSLQAYVEWHGINFVDEINKSKFMQLPKTGKKTWCDLIDLIDNEIYN